MLASSTFPTFLLNSYVTFSLFVHFRPDFRLSGRRKTYAQKSNVSSEGKGGNLKKNFARVISWDTFEYLTHLFHIQLYKYKSYLYV